jgi:hypothetical protein
VLRAANEWGKIPKRHRDERSSGPLPGDEFVLVRQRRFYDLRGLRTSSPEQFGQTWPSSSAHGSQNVHSYVQM